MSNSEQDNSADEEGTPIDLDGSAELPKWELWTRIELDKGRQPAEILAEMVEKRFAPKDAEDLVARVQAHQADDYKAAADERGEWRAAVAKFRRNMIIGGLYFASGTAVSVKVWLYPGSIGWLVILVAVAAVAFGSLRFAYGLLGYLRPMSIRLDGRYVPGRRIGTYSPGTPRSRYSRFT